jgi:hypothetical protein
MANLTTMPTNSPVTIEQLQRQTVNQKKNKKPKHKPNETRIGKKLSPTPTRVNTHLHRGPPSAADDPRNHRSPP